MTNEEEAANWLHSAVFACPGCGEDLYRVDHSPMLDEYAFYCDQCANHVVISWYDAVTLAIDRQVEREGVYATSWERERAKRRRLEARLKPCDCGGHYKSDAPRRCPHCRTVAVEERPDDVDLQPGYMWWEEDRDPTDEEIRLADAYFTKHVRQSDIWRDENGGSE